MKVIFRNDLIGTIGCIPTIYSPPVEVVTLNPEPDHKSLARSFVTVLESGLKAIQIARMQTAPVGPSIIIDD